MDGTEQDTSRGFGKAVVITGIAQFMAGLDNLVVTTALPVIRHRLHTGFAGLEWTVNAYTLSFAVLLLGGATLGDRFGRRRMFIAGIALFTVASAASALAPNIAVLIVARAIQGAGGALIVPLSLTMLSAAVAPERRNLALGIWGAVGGLAIAIGPLVGGAVVEGVSWQFIFWLNVPIGLALIPAVRFGLAESRGARQQLDFPGLVTASLGLFGIVFALVRGGAAGWTSGQVDAGFVGGAALLVTFLGIERRSSAPMLPTSLFASRQFSIINIVALLMSFGMFGAIFLLAQFLQSVQGESPLTAGIRTLPWTGMPVLVAPLAGLLVDKIGGKAIVTLGLGFQAVGLAWLATVIGVHSTYAVAVPAFVICGIGMSLFFVPVASLVLSSVRPDQEGIASGANNAIRELGGVLGISVLGAIFSSAGGYATAADFVHGLHEAVMVGAVIVAIGAVLMGLMPKTKRTAAAEDDDRFASAVATFGQPVDSMA